MSQVQGPRVKAAGGQIPCVFLRLLGVNQLGFWFINVLCCLQKELDFHGLKRKNNLAVLCAVKHARVQERGHVAVNSLHISANATGSLTN